MGMAMGYTERFVSANTLSIMFERYEGWRVVPLRSVALADYKAWTKAFGHGVEAAFEEAKLKIRSVI